MAEHEHRWTLATHLDGCHWFTSAFVCECGASASTYDERNIDEDPYSAVWMEEAGECPRCRDLMDGAEPAHHSEIREAVS